MSHIMTALAMRQTGLKPSAKIVLYWLADHYNESSGACFPSLKTLAEECEMDKSTVVRQLDALEAAGFIERSARARENGSQTSTEYFLHMRPVAKYNSPCRKTQQAPVAKCNTHNLGTLNLGKEPIDDANASLALSAPSDVEAAVEDFNAMAERAGLPKAQKITPARKSALSKRLKDAGGLDGWRVALEKVEASPFCTGQNDKGWKADLDFILQERSFTRIMEGTYDAKKPTGTSQQSRNGGNSPAHESLFAGFASVARRHGG